jgi:putative acetyltransferase
MNITYRRLEKGDNPVIAALIRIYEKSGFEHIPKAMGNSGHFFCNVWMLKDLGNN